MWICEDAEIPPSPPDYWWWHYQRVCSMMQELWQSWCQNMIVLLFLVLANVSTCTILCVSRRDFLQDRMYFRDVFSSDLWLTQSFYTHASTYLDPFRERQTISIPMIPYIHEPRSQKSALRKRSSDSSATCNRMILAAYVENKKYLAFLSKIVTFFSNIWS